MYSNSEDYRSESRSKYLNMYFSIRFLYWFWHHPVFYWFIGLHVFTIYLTTKHLLNTSKIPSQNLPSILQNIF